MKACPLFAKGGLSDLFDYEDYFQGYRYGMSGKVHGVVNRADEPHVVVLAC